MIIIHPKDREELRQWFVENVAREKEVYVHCIRKKVLPCGEDLGEAPIPYLDVVEEALCFGWIDSVCKPLEGEEGYLQRLSPRRKNSPWTELNKERCRRLIRLGRMTKAGRKVLPSLAQNSFKPEQWIIDAIKSDKEAWKHHRAFPKLYVRVRLYNIQWYWNNSSMPDAKSRALKMLDKYIQAAHDGKMIGEWNDGGRLTEA